MNQHPALAARVDAGVRLGLSRVSAFLKELGDPHLRVPVVHVAGTNGKGSVCAFVESALRAQGLRTGLLTSPHLSHINERIQLDGEMISDEAFDALLTELDATAREWGRARLTADGEEPVPLTYFELLTVAGFVAFARAGVDVAVIEVGLGGRLDATNVVQPQVCAITTISLDHCDRLGYDLGSIASEKAGIFKEGVPVVLGRLPREAMRVVRSMAAQSRCAMRVLGEGFDASGRPEGFDVVLERARYGALSIGLSGDHQVDNAAVAVALLDELGRRNPALQVREDALRRGLSQARHPGRCEWLSSRLLVDGAHNIAGAETLASTLSALPRVGRRTLLLGASNDKDVRSLAAALAPEVDRVFTTSCAHPRAMSPGQVAESLVGLGAPVMPAGPIEEALPAALEGDGLVVAAGSLFLVAAVRDLSEG